MIHKGTYDGTIYHNPANRICIISVKTADKEVPLEARSTRRYRDHLIRFVATGYELPRTDAVDLELDGEWKQGKYGMQFQVEQWRQIVPRTKSGVEGYLASGLIKGIGPATATLIVSRFGEDTLDILQKRPERLLEIKGITESKLEEIKTSYAESRMLQDLLAVSYTHLAEISSKSRVDGYDDFIFVNRDGDVQNQGNLNKALRRMMRDCNDEILEKYGADSDPVLLPQFSCHILRHTFATRLCESGANLKFIQSILGHADVSTTMNIYVDVTDALKKKEITAFDDYMTTKLET